MANEKPYGLTYLCRAGGVIAENACTGLEYTRFNRPAGDALIKRPIQHDHPASAPFFVIDVKIYKNQ